MNPANAPAKPAAASSHRAQTLSVLALALVLRLLVLRSVITNNTPQWLFTRGIEMGLLAKSLLAGLGLSSPFGGATGPTAFIAPAYPIFVAGIFRIFGIDSSGSAIVIMLLHIAANLLTIWLLMHLARKLFCNTTALVAGLVWACSFPLLWLPSIFWDTSFSICLLLGLITLVLRFKDRATNSAWIVLGAYVGLTALLNPALLFATWGILAWLAWQTRRINRTGLAIAALAFVLAFSAWPIRNARVFHAFIPLRTTVGFELWMGNHEGSTGFLQENLFPMYNSAELADYIKHGELAYTQNKSHLAEQYIEQHPTRFLNLTARRIFRFWTGTGNDHGSPIFALHATLTSLFGLAGLWFLFRKGRRDLAALFAIPFLIFPAPYYLTHAEFRYRLILDPLLTLLAAYAAVTLARRYATQPNQLPTPTPQPTTGQAILG